MLKQLGQVVLRYRVTTAETNTARRTASQRPKEECFVLLRNISHVMLKCTGKKMENVMK